MSDESKCTVTAIVCGTLLLMWIVFNVRSCNHDDSMTYQYQASQCKSKLEACAELCR